MRNQTVCAREFVYTTTNSIEPSEAKCNRLPSQPSQPSEFDRVTSSISTAISDCHDSLDMLCARLEMATSRSEQPMALPDIAKCESTMGERLNAVLERAMMLHNRIYDLNDRIVL